jgi:hypothetical protein
MSRRDEVVARLHEIEAYIENACDEDEELDRNYETETEYALLEDELYRIDYPNGESEVKP